MGKAGFLLPVGVILSITLALRSLPFALGDPRPNLPGVSVIDNSDAVFLFDLDSETEGIQGPEDVRWTKGETYSIDVILRGAEKILGISCDIMFDNEDLEIALIHGKLGEVNFDSISDLRDVSALGYSYNTSIGQLYYQCAYDLQGDGAIDLFELDHLAQGYEVMSPYWSDQQGLPQGSTPRESVFVVRPMTLINTEGKVDDLVSSLLLRPGQTDYWVGDGQTDLLIATIQLGVREESPHSETLLQFEWPTLWDVDTDILNETQFPTCQAQDSLIELHPRPSAAQDIASAGSSSTPGSGQDPETPETSAQRQSSLCDYIERADINHDGIVDRDDLMLLIISWRGCESGLHGDINDNGVLDYVDIAIFSQIWYQYECFWGPKSLKPAADIKPTGSSPNFLAVDVDPETEGIQLQKVIPRTAVQGEMSLDVVISVGDSEITSWNAAALPISLSTSGSPVRSSTVEFLADDYMSVRQELSDSAIQIIGAYRWGFIPGHYPFCRLTFAFEANARTDLVFHPQPGCRIANEEQYRSLEPMPTKLIWGDLPPGQAGVAIVQQNPGPGADLILDIDPLALDPDGDDVAYEWSWYASTDLGQSWTQHADLDDATVVPGERVALGDIWRVEVQPFVLFSFQEVAERVDGIAASGELFVEFTPDGIIDWRDLFELSRTWSSQSSPSPQLTNLYQLVEHWHIVFPPAQ